MNSRSFLTTLLSRVRASRREEAARAEEALRESEERFRKVFEDSPLGMSIVTPQFVFTRVNSRLCDMLGYTEDELIGRGFSEFTLHDDVPDNLMLAQAAFENRVPVYDVEKRYVRKDGQVIQCKVKGVVIRDQAGNPLYGVGIMEDITAVKEAEEALRQSEERFRLLAENAQDIIFRYRFADPRGIEYISPAFSRISGYSVEEFLADSELHRMIVHPEDRDMLETVLRERLAGPSDLRWIAKDGSVVWTEQRNSLVYDDAGRLVAVEGIVRDITQRVRAEQTLRESEARFRLLAENAQDIIFRYRTVPDRGFEYLSPAATAVVGYTPEELYAGPDILRKAVHPDDRELLEKAMAGEADLPTVVRWMHKDGSVVWTEQRNRPVYDESGNLVAVEGIARDITERRRMEEALEQAREELEERVERQFLEKNPYGLTFREFTVLHLVAAGKADKEIAQELGISVLTASKHVANILGKMDAASRTEAGVRAVREGLIE